MTERPPMQPLFLARDSYRRRRMADAARVLPIVGMVLVFLPLAWSGSGRTATTTIYLFAVWAVLILLAAVLARTLGRPDPGSDPTERPVLGGTDAGS